MSPPKVSLAAKTPSNPPEVDESLPQEKSDKLDLFPVPTVTIESERAVRARHMMSMQQRKRRLVCAAAMVTVLSIAALSLIVMVPRIKHRHRKHFECHYGKMRLPEHVKVDHDHRLIYAHHDHDHQSNTPAIHMLHEYNRRLIAYKDTQKNICYIDRLDETFEDGYARWVSYEKHGHPAGKMLGRVSEKPIEKEVLRHVGDIHIYAHCMSATSYWFMEIEEKQVVDQVVIHV